jgi:hypothetical protein
MPSFRQLTGGGTQSAAGQSNQSPIGHSASRAQGRHAQTKVEGCIGRELNLPLRHRLALQLSSVLTPLQRIFCSR